MSDARFPSEPRARLDLGIAVTPGAAGMGDEAGLVAEAAALLGGDEPILAAGVFALANIAYAQAGGVAAGALAADVAGGSPLGAAAGAALGSWAAKHAAAAAQGVTLQLLVAVSPSRIHVCNRGGAEEGLSPVVASLERSATEVTVRRLGLSRRLILRDTVHDTEIELHGTAAPFRPQAGPDRLVMQLLSD